MLSSNEPRAVFVMPVILPWLVVVSHSSEPCRCGIVTRSVTSAGSVTGAGPCSGGAVLSGVWIMVAGVFQ